MYTYVFKNSDNDQYMNSVFQINEHNMFPV